MALFTLQDLTTPATREDVQAAIYRVLAVVGVNTTAWGSGQVVRTMVVATSVVLAAFSQLQARIAAAGYLELSQREWLTLVARYVYGVERIDATFASGSVTLVNHGGGLYSVDAGDFVVANAVTGKTFRNTQAFELPSGIGQTIVVPVSAVEAGSGSNAAVGELTRMVTTLLNVVCTNATVLIASDVESDPALRVRCKERLGALSPNGPWDAYAYTARNAKRRINSGVDVQYVTAGITRTRVRRDGYGNVFLTVANDSGAVLGDPDDDGTVIGAINQAVQKQAVPLSVNAIVQSAVPVNVPVHFTVYCYTTARQTDEQIVAAVDVALAQFFRQQPIGGNTLVDGTPGKVYVDAIRACIGSAVPQIFHVELQQPAADVTLTPEQVAVYAGALGSDVVQVVPGEGSVAA